MKNSSASYHVKKISPFRRWYLTGCFFPVLKTQLKSIVFDEDLVVIEMMDGCRYELVKGLFRVVNYRQSKDRKCFLKIETSHNEDIEIFGVPGELTDEEWKDIKDRLGCLYKVKYKL